MAQFGLTPHTMTAQEEHPPTRLDPRDLPKPGRSVLNFMARGTAVLLVAAGGLFLLAWVALYGFLLPRVGAWKPEIESRASAALGLTVRIGDIQAPSAGWVPTVVLTEVTLLDEQGRSALRLPRVSAAVSPRSLLSLELRFEQLLIEDAALEIRRDHEGRIRVAGLSLEDEVPAQVDGSLQAGEWLLAQGEFAIRRGQVRWVDERRQAPALVLQDVEFLLRNGLRQHDWQLDATPPAELGERASVRGRFRHGLFAARSDWRGWVGEVYVELPQADVDALRPHVDLPVELLGGRGAARLWVDVDRGRLRGATADVALRDVRLRWPGVAEPMVFERFDGRLLARQDAQSVTLGLERVGFTTGEGQTWPASDMKLVLRHAPAPGMATSPAASASMPVVPAASASSASGSLATAGSGVAQETAASEPVLPLLFDGLAGRVIVGGEFTAAELDLSLMASVAGRAPIGLAAHQALASLLPQGRIQDMRATWEGPVEAPTRYRVSARLENLRLEAGTVLPARSADAAPVIGRPGVRAASMRLEANESGGRVDLEIRQGQLVFPGLFDQPEVPLEEMQARLSWQFKGEGVELQLAPMTLRNADLEGELQGSWRGTWADAARGRGEIDLNARIQNMRADMLHRYLPNKALPDTSRYLRRAVRGGRLQDVTLRVKGALASFPYEQAGAKGEFRVSGLWRDGTYLMLPEEPGYPAWPEATRVDARIRVSGRKVEFSDVRGRIMGVDITRTSGQVDWLQPSVPLALDLQARGPAQDFLRYVQATPINDWTSRVLAAAQATGPAALSLRLDLPLVGSEPARVRGVVQLGGNDLRLSNTLPPLQSARGRVEFSERGFNITAGTGQLLGGEVTLDGGISPGGSLRLNLQGQAQAAAIKAAPELAWLGPIAGRLTGQAPYRVAIGVAAGQLQWLLTSPLSGMGIDLPAPVNKPERANWASTPLRVEVTGLGGSAGQERERIDVQLGRLVQGRFLRNAASGALVAGSVNVGSGEAPAALPASGLDVAVLADRLELDPWRALLTAPGPVAPSAAEGSFGLTPRQFRITAGRVFLMGRQLDDVRAVAAPLVTGEPAGGWALDLQAAELAGRVEWRPALAVRRDAHARLQARLSRLSIPQGAAETVDEMPGDEPMEWPALDVVVEDFELRGRRLGRLEVQAEAERAGRDWQLTRLQLSNPDATLRASGTWAVAVNGVRAAAAAMRRTSMDFELDVKDSGALMSRLGWGEALRAGEGRVSGQVGWRGSPLSPNVRSIQGQMKVDVRNGQFLKADAGAARLLGVLSLQSLPRRLVLDFRDVFQEGFPFDSFVGDVTLQEGVASTNNLRMRGIQAAVLMEGSADLRNETQDLRVLVVPEINAGTASLAYATINPALGLGTFLAQLFLRRPLMVANTREFRITGGWADPKVERLQRSTPLSNEEVDRAINAPASASAPSPAVPAAPNAPVPRRTP